MAKININFFENETKVKPFAAGETIFSLGEIGEVMYGIQSGSVAVHYEDEVIRVLEPGDIFGEMSIADKCPRSATAIAKTDCNLVEIDSATFLFKIQHHPTFALFVLQTVIERLRDQTLRR
ncbi:MAG: cyclic nucleotide-binding domain-containing protein [Anaerolineae bacterium]|nr:cyclic nucleotide-binding domain-containing protein [Anaerolineae bacterium]